MPLGMLRHDSGVEGFWFYNGIWLHMAEKVPKGAGDDLPAIWIKPPVAFKGPICAVHDELHCA
ncbi:hypothetical protein ASE82_09520 [Sphingomonas sp. Leaf230]|nr:hypothetical protein ASE82_09520 [Sphingomonas sp. Leaf230]